MRTTTTENKNVHVQQERKISSVKFLFRLLLSVLLHIFTVDLQTFTAQHRLTHSAGAFYHIVYQNSSVQLKFRVKCIMCIHFSSVFSRVRFRFQSSFIYRRRKKENQQSNISFIDNNERKRNSNEKKHCSTLFMQSFSLFILIIIILNFLVLIMSGAHGNWTKNLLLRWREEYVGIFDGIW